MILLSHILLWILVLTQGLVSCILLRQLYELQRTSSHSAGRHAIVEGSPAPEFSAIDLATDERIEGKELYSGRHTLLIFLSAGCGNCIQITDALHRLPLNGRIRPVIHCSGDRRACQTEFAPLLDLGAVHIVAEDEINKSAVLSFSLISLPAAVLLDSDGKIEKIYTSEQMLTDPFSWLEAELSREVQIKTDTRAGQEMQSTSPVQKSAASTVTVAQEAALDRDSLSSISR